MIVLINKWGTESPKPNHLIYSLNKLFSIRESLVQRGVELKFKAKGDVEFENLLETWTEIKLYYSRGYKLKYEFPENFVNMIETNIDINGDVYIPKMLITEEDFRLEGYDMKNCMGKQFTNGNLYIYVSLRFKRKKINLQYRKGNLLQRYGRANTVVMEIFNPAIEVLTNRFKSCPYVDYKKVKYNFLIT
jgi:hypothetical protein